MELGQYTVGDFFDLWLSPVLRSGGRHLGL